MSSASAVMAAVVSLRGMFCLIVILIFYVSQCSALIEGIYCGMENCYDVLGLPKDANKGDVAKAYRQLARKHHPDMHRTEEAKLVAEEKFRVIATAYEILRDDDARKDYDYMLEHPDEMYMHYYRYYRRRMAPKVDVRIVMVCTVSVISVFQYLSARQRYSTAIAYCMCQPKYRMQAVSIAKEEGLLSDNGRKKSKKTKEELKMEEEAIIKKIVEENMDIKGGFAKPSLKNILWVQLFTIPAYIAFCVYWQLRWIWKFGIKGDEYGIEEKLYLIRKYLGMNEYQFSALDHQDYLHRELWIKEKFKVWKEIQDEEQRMKLAQNNKYKSYRRYMKNRGPSQITFED